MAKKSHGYFHGLFEFQIRKGPWVWVARGPFKNFLKYAVWLSYLGRPVALDLPPQPV
jgi:hypothetical protein